jgi:hypothetical protein
MNRLFDEAFLSSSRDLGDDVPETAQIQPDADKWLRIEQSTSLSEKNRSGNTAGIRKSVLALLQVNNIKIGLTPRFRAVGTGL